MIAAGGDGDVRIAWMDNRTGYYNLWYRESVDWGHSWSEEVTVSIILKTPAVSID